MPAAGAVSADEQKSTVSFNEYDLIQTLQASPINKLERQGHSQEEIMEIKGALLETKLVKRASLSQDKLRGLGYTADEISILKEIETTGQVDLSEAQLRAIAGTCTGTIVPNSAGKSEYRVSYEWEWDHAPVICYKDSFAIRWEAMGSDGLPVDSTAGSLTVGYVEYYDYDGYFSAIETLQPNRNNIEFNVVKFDFRVGSGTPEVSTYAKRGSGHVQIQKDAGVTRDFYYLKVGALYGHTVVNIGFPSLSVSAGGIGIGFSGGLSTDNIGGDKCKIDLNNQKTAISG